MDQHSCHTMRQPFNYFNCRPSVDPFSQFYLFRATMMESTTNPPERSSRKICTISAAQSFLFSNKKLLFYWLSASLPRQLLDRVQAFRKSWLECYLVHSLGFIVLFFAQPNVQRLSSMSLILRNQSIVACILISLPSINTILSIKSRLFPMVHKVEWSEPRPCAKQTLSPHRFPVRKGNR